MRLYPIVALPNGAARIETDRPVYLGGISVRWLDRRRSAVRKRILARRSEA